MEEMIARGRLLIPGGALDFRHVLLTASGTPGQSGRIARSAVPMVPSSGQEHLNLQSMVGESVRDQIESHSSATHNHAQVSPLTTHSFPRRV